MPTTSSSHRPEGNETICTNLKMLFENLRIRTLSCFKHHINIAVVLLSSGSFFLYKSVLWVNGVLIIMQHFLANLSIQLEVHFIEIKGMTLMVYNYINCFVDKLLALSLVTNYTTNCSIIVVIIIIMMIIIIIIGFCCKPFKTDPSQELIKQNNLGGGNCKNLYFSFDTGGFGLLRVFQLGGPW